MDIVEKIRQKALKFLGLQHLVDNPYGERYTFINNMENVNKQRTEECRVWYIGDSNKLASYYLGKDVFGNQHEPIYNRNRMNYFWSISEEECNIKRVHSGLAKAMVDTMVSVIGFPDIEADEKYKIDDLIEHTHFRSICMQQQMPLTMAIGWGAYKINISKRDGRKYPSLRFYEAENVDFVVKENETIGIIFKDYYSYEGKNYLLIETRRLNEKGYLTIEYGLYRISGKYDVISVPMSTIPELADYEDVEVPGYSKLLAVPCRFYFDPDNPSYGRSIYEGKFDIFDDLDQSLSQRSQTCRVSTPVEYYPVDLMERSKATGMPIAPKAYNRQFIKKSGVPDGDGNKNDSIETTQPSLNFEQYSQEQKELVNMALIGFASPATFGINIAKDSTELSQREKEKVTIMTRNNIIESQMTIDKELINQLLDAKEYIDTGMISIEENREISIKFSEFANPSFENLSATLYPMWVAGAISTRMYVNKLYGDSLSDEEKEEEIKSLDEQRNKDSLIDLDDFDRNNGIKEDKEDKEKD